MSTELSQKIPQKEQMSRKEPSRGGRWRRLLVTTAAAGVAAVGVSEVATAQEKSNSATVAVAEKGTVQEKLGASCPVIGNEQIEHARNIIDKGEALEGDAINPDSPELAYMVELNVEPAQFKDWARVKASEHNLTLVKNEPAIKRIQSAQSADESTEAINDFTSEYGFTMKFKEDVGLNEVKKGGEELMRAFTLVPKELVDASSVKEVTVGENLPESQGSMSLSIEDFLKGEGYIHGFSHQLDGTTCGKDLPNGEDGEEKADIAEKLFPLDPDTVGEGAPDREKALQVLSRLQSQVASADPSADMMGYLRSISILDNDNPDSTYKTLGQQYKG